jgi:sulfate adenylyltransferase subunit 2
MPATYHLPRLRTLEADAIHVMGEVAAEFERPEVWSLYNGRIRKGGHARVWPISDWTELDAWQYIAEEALEVPSIYFAHEREVFARDGVLDAVRPFVELIEGEKRQGYF